MANIPLKSIQFPGLADTYTVPSNAGELPYDKSATYPADTVGKALQNIGDSSAPAIIETATGSIASFTDGANVPVKDLVAEIVPLQSGSGDPSPSNVRAISGWTEANISVTGVNLWDEEWEVGTLTDGEPTSYPNYFRTKNFIKIVPNESYYQYTGAGDLIYRNYYNAKKEFLSITAGRIGEFTTPSEAHYMKFVDTNRNTYNNDISINYPSTDHDYHAYNGETHTISFASAGTVYGGRLDVTSGVLTVDRAMVDLGDIGWTYYPTLFNGSFGASIHDMKQNTAESICSKYKSISSDLGSYDDAICTKNNGNSLYVRDTSYTDASAFKSANIGTELVYDLATPQTYQLAPTEVKTLLKNNNVWADTGDVTVEYVADTKTFIENLVNA